MFYNIEIMTFELAEKISQWTYENEYSIYSFDKSEGTLKELLSGDYFSCLDQEGRLIGYFCKGYSANIPTVECFNLRAISLYQKFGFSIKTIVTHQKSLDNFFIMMQ